MGDALARYTKTRREELGLSLNQVAQRCNLTKSHVHDIERGRSKNPTVKNVCALAAALQVSAVTLFRYAAEMSDG